MPLTAFQKEVLAVILANRSPESHFAGGIVLNAPDEAARYSHDFDIFHEASADLARASERDVACLAEAGFAVEKVNHYGEWNKENTFRKIVVTRGEERTEIDWAADSAFRFFPIERDAVLGWRLHLFDMAINKALAVSARMETRDYVDIVELGRIFPLEAIVWAACGKDPGFSPLSLMKMMLRFARLDPAKLNEIQARKLNPLALKEAWIAMSDRAQEQMIRLADERPETPIGVAFVDEAGRPGWLLDNPTLRVHAPSVRGCWPFVHGVHDQITVPKADGGETGGAQVGM